MTIRLVTGPPCAGKSTYVTALAADGDLVVDFDEILAGLGGDRTDREDPRRGAAEMVRSALEKNLPSDRDAWVIRTLPDPAERHAHAARIGADEVLVLTAPLEDLHRRARDDDRPQWTTDVIDQWWDHYRPHDDDHMPATGPTTPTGDTSAMDPKLLAFLMTVGALNFLETPGNDDSGGGGGDGEQDPQGDEDGAGGGGDPAGDPAPKPKPPAKQSPAPQGPDLGFPSATPTAEMTPAQRAAYWKFQAYKHDDEALAEKTDEEREQYWRGLARTAESANKRGPGYVAGLEQRAAAADEVELSEEDRNALAQQAKLVRYAVQAQVPSLKKDSLDELMGVLNAQALIGEDGDPDEDAIAKVAGLLKTHAGRQHGGHRDPGSGSKAEDARERYNQRFRKSKNSR